jgi:uncharacterized membrane-anchored protein
MSTFADTLPFNKSGAFAHCSTSMKGTMLLIRFSLIIACVVAVTTPHARGASAAGERPELPGGPAVKWTKGPAKAQVGSVAALDVPAGYVFTDGAGARAMLEAMGNLTSGEELGFLAPTSFVWFATFRFSDEGYVKDDEKDKLNADKLLKSIKAGTEAANKERKSRGWPTIHVVGWEQPPAYDPETHNLGWAIRAESEGEPVVNFNTRLLGRKGIMSVNLVVEPDKLPATLPEFKGLLTSYDYNSGQRYAEYRSGDKVAAYGLTALVVGGAAAGAAKLGLFAWLAAFLKKGWKLVVIGVVAIGGFLKRIVLGRDRVAD